MNARKNTQVSKRKGQEVLRRWSRRESSREPLQHLSATKRSRSVTIKKRLAPPELATLINLINQVPDGLPSLRELRQTARESSNANLGLRGPMAYGEQDRLDQLIFQTIQQKAPALLAKLPAPPDLSDRLSHLTWRARGIDDPSRAQLYYRYNYMVEGRAKKTGGDLRQINQLDQHLWSGINTASAALSHRPGGTSCEAISIFLT